MPYQHERAGYRGLHHFGEQTHTSAAWRHWHPADQLANAIPPALACIPSDWQPRSIVAIDGSMVPVPLPSNPLIHLGAWTVSAITLDWIQIDHLNYQRPIDPVALRACMESTTLSGVLPSGLLEDANNQPAPVMLREYIFRLLSNTQHPDAQESLLTTYAMLYHHRFPRTQRFQRCPWWQLGCSHRVTHITTGPCSCADQRAFYQTDALRLHERYTRVGINMTVWNETMRVLEHLWFVGSGINHTDMV